MTDWKKLVEDLEVKIRNEMENSKTVKNVWYVSTQNALSGRYNGIIFLGINSGGEHDRKTDKYEEFLECDGYSFYHHDKEIWKGAKKIGEHRLQLQIRLLFCYLYYAINGRSFRYDIALSKIENINIVEKEQGYEKFIKGVLAGNICPFKSSSLENLLYPWDVQKPYLIKFWNNVFKDNLRDETKLIVTMGNEVLDIVEKIYSLKDSDFEKLSSGWGKSVISIYQSNNPNTPTIMNLPHLSRFAIFGRVDGLSKIEDLFGRNLF